jgi:hypothetical protein
VGNSPDSLVDPDGKFGLLIALTEDVKEIADLHIEVDDEEEVFNDCIE